MSETKIDPRLKLSFFNELASIMTTLTTMALDLIHDTRPIVITEEEIQHLRKVDRELKGIQLLTMVKSDERQSDANTQEKLPN